MASNEGVYDQLREILGTNDASDIGPDDSPVNEDLREHDSSPTVPMTDVQKARYMAIAQDLEEAKVQAYIEANFGIQLLKVLQTVIPMIAGRLGL